MTSSSSYFNSNYYSAWERTYWEQGPVASMEYCAQKAAKLKKIIKLLKRIDKITAPSQEALLETPFQVARHKAVKKRYEKDRVTLSSEDDLIHVSICGRGEQGRTPFNFPSFRKRYELLFELKGYVFKKINFHSDGQVFFENCLQLSHFSSSNLRKTRKKGRFSFNDRALLEERKEFHTNAQQKWSGRYSFLWNPLLTPSELAAGWLVPTASKTELEMMHFDPLHKDAILGRGTGVTVLERGGVDPTHSKFLTPIEHDTENQASVSDVQHGTFVCGIISKAAPLAKIKVVSKSACSTIATDQVLNYSGWFQDHFSALMNKPDLLQRYVKTHHDPSCSQKLETALQLPQSPRKRALKELSRETNEKLLSNFVGDLSRSLLIQAIGNRGVMLDQNDEVVQGHHWISSAQERRERCILVVNLRPNGLYPASSSCLPGKTFADFTLCAIGTDVASTLPGDRLGSGSGSSFATPFVTSAALLIQEKFPRLSKEEIRRCLLEGATPILIDASGSPRFVEVDQLDQFPPEIIQKSREIYGWGLLNAQRSLELAQRAYRAMAAATLKKMVKKRRILSYPTH